METTIYCSECKYFRNIQGVKTCGKFKNIINENAIGCYSGEK